jgi:hypothetical protein
VHSTAVQDRQLLLTTEDVAAAGMLHAKPTFTALLFPRTRNASYAGHGTTNDQLPKDFVFSMLVRIRDIP